MRKLGPVQQQLIDNYEKNNIARCSIHQIEQKAIKNWIIDNNITTEYIGRSINNQKVKDNVDVVTNKWANDVKMPFRNEQPGDRDRVCDHFEINQAPTFSNAELSTLHGKLLVCHCSSNQRCHGDSLVKRVIDINKAE